MTVVDAMLGNAAVAAGLALVAVAVGYAVRSPAIRHAAWVLVLLKFITPPLFAIPLPVLPASWGERPTNPLVGGSLVEWLLVAWAVGAVGWLGWQGRRIVRFRRRLRAAEEAPAEVVAATVRLAVAFGIDRPPAVKVATGIGSPMLWGWGREAVVLFPRELLARLAPEARDTLLAHELAHFLRRDHWVRVLEYLAGGLYWWHPAVWLARTGIEAAEEECCDAWVVGGLSASPRRYAEALLATVDFEAELRRPCLPPGACAANHSARLLHRRLVCIADVERPPRLPGGIVVRVLVLAALLTQPVLRAAQPEPTPVAQEPEPIIVASPSSKPPLPKPKLRVNEPRAWATVTIPTCEPTVLARDRDVILRLPDGTDRILGPGRPLAVSFDPSGRRITTVGPDSLVRTWDDRGNLLLETNAEAAARSVAYTPDGSAILVLDAAGGITVRDPNTLAIVAGWSVEGPANSLACAPDGRTVAVSFGSWQAKNGWVECWSIPDRRKLARYTADAPVGASRFSPDGTVIILGGWDGRVFWRLTSSGSLVAERQLSKDLVATAAFCPDAGTLPLDPPPEPAPPPTPLDPSPFGMPAAIRLPAERRPEDRP